MEVRHSRLNNVKYFMMQYYSVSTALTLATFIDHNHYAIHNITATATTMYDTNGILQTIPLGSWLVVAEHDNTELYILDTITVKNMFNI